MEEEGLVLNLHGEIPSDDEQVPKYVDVLAEAGSTYNFERSELMTIIVSVNGAHRISAL